MPLGGADNPFGGLELNSQTAGASAPPAQPIEDLVAGEEAAKNQRLAGEAAHRTAEEPEKTRAEILLAVQTEWEFCGLEPCDSNAELATDILAAYQTDRQADDPSYILGENETQARLNWIVSNGVDRRARQADEAKTTEAEMAETRSATDEAAKETADNKAHAEWLAQFDGDFVAAVEAADTMPTNGNEKLEAEKAKLMAFRRILTLASAVPADAKIIRQRMAAQDFSQGIPSPEQFIQTAIFSSPEYDSGVSEATQKAIAAEFGLTPQRPDRPRNASEMQTTLREGRGTKPITEIQSVEEPPGSGNFVEREVVVGEEPIPFTDSDRLVLSDDPFVTIYPEAPGSVRHRVEGMIDGAAPIGFAVDVPKEGAFPATDINNRVNEQFARTVLNNRGLSGAMSALFGRGDSSFGVEAQTDLTSVGQNDMTQAFFKMSLGENTTLGSRFLANSELKQLDDTTRWLTPNGDFGAFNQMDPQATIALMNALFGTSHGEITGNMERANQFVNTGGAEAPSFEALYAKMYPEDANAGYPRLERQIGTKGMAGLTLNHTAS